MIPKVEGPEDIHYVDRLLAQLEAKAGLDRPLLVHAILETARGVANVEEICAASPRMQGLSLGPADLAANRRMKTTRVGGGHPGYLVREDPDRGRSRRAARRPTSRTCGTTRSPAWSTPASRYGVLPFYGPFGDIADTVACEDQFRNAYLLGCVGAWSLHPSQIEIAKRVFSPDPADVAHAQRVIEAMGDGTGAVMLDGKMEDDASVKQCQVIVELATQLAARDPELAAAYGLSRMSDDAPARAARCSTCRRPTSGRWRRRRRSRATRSSSTSRTPSRPTPRRSHASRRSPRCGPGEYGRRELTIRCNGLATPWGADDLAAAGAAGPAAVVDPEGRLGRRTSTRSPPTSTRPGAAATPIWAMIETPTAIFDVRAIAAPPAGRRARDGHQRPRQGAPRPADRRPRQPRCRTSRPRCSPPARPARSSSTASTTT